jgi:hypothetical protein
VNKKAKCEICKRTITIKNLSKNKVTGQMLCKICNKKIGSNKFYSLLIHKNKNFISKFSITDTEKQVLKSKGVNVKKLCDGLKYMKEKKRINVKKDAIENKNKVEKERKVQKNFLEGLK